MSVIKVVKARCTCEKQPSQFQGHTKDGQTVYARYRSGKFRLHVGKGLKGALEAKPLMVGTFDFEAMSFEQLKEITATFVRWPSELVVSHKGVSQ